MSDTPSLRSRLGAAAWIGLGGGLLFGLSEAATILSQNATAAGRALFGVAAGASLVIALDGLLLTLAMTLIGLVLALVPWPRGAFKAASEWAALCVAVLIGLFMMLSGMTRFGVVAGSVGGLRALLLSGLSLGASVGAGLATFWVARAVFGSPHAAVARWTRRATLAVWIGVGLLPIVYAILRNR